VAVGAASRDLAAGDARGWRLGGGVTYGALTLARLGLDVRALIGVDAEAAEANELDVLRDSGAEVELVRLARAPVFDNIETPAGRRQRALSVSDGIPVETLPMTWRNPDAALLAPVAAELGDDWAEAFAPATRVALGWQGLLRTLAQGEDVLRRAPERRAAVERAELIGVGRDDFDPGIDPETVFDLASEGATVILTDSQRGGIVFRRASGGARARDRYEAFAPAASLDPTGAGDTFLAAFLAAWLEPTLAGGSPGEGSATRFAAAAASLVVEAPGLAGVPDLAAVRRRLEGDRPTR
jgi:sugar/nucleoside kinase (ribokinase family)